MNLEQIKTAVDHGLIVHWKNGVYTVVKDSSAFSGYAVAYRLGTVQENRIGLTWSDGIRMNGRMEEFYVAAQSLSYAVDDALAERETLAAEEAKNVRYVGFLAGAGYVWVAVWSYLQVGMDDEEACELAIDLLLEKKWFADETRTEPSIVI